MALEWYAADSGPDKPHYSASLAKALVGGLSLMAALADGRMKPDDFAFKYIPAWKTDASKSRITIRHLATHSSGIEDAEAPRAPLTKDGGLPHEKLTGWEGAFWKRDPGAFTIALAEAPVIFTPGTQFHYSNPGMAALAYAVTVAMKGSDTPDIRSLLARRFMEPLGIPDREWSIGYGRPEQLDGLQLYANWGGGGFSARTTAKLGRLMLRRGNWDGRQLVPAEWVDRATAYAGTPLPDRTVRPASPGSGLCWWTNFDGVWPRVPRDAFAGAGAGHQLLVVVPSMRLVVVRNGAPLEDPRPRERFWAAVEQHVLNPLMQAVRSRTLPAAAPYPRSSVIGDVEFAPASAIRRDAIDSDNWPITWGDDDALYTSYGDGNGFDPRTERKLSLGFAKILGGPEDFRGINIRAPEAEREGNGSKGPKASGMLMVDGILYMWVRNVGNSQLVWSEDRGRSWHWGFRLETSFGCPAFLNFGRNYAGARYGYVYTYSSDGPSCYEQYDQVVLARVRKDRIRERSAYEFFARLNTSGRPVWSTRIEDRGPAFGFPRHCERVDAVFNAGLRRYLLAVGYNHDGGWGIYEAPAPWGPWTTAFHTESWDQGRTHGYRLPSKWISADGRTMWLVFSGVASKELLNDAFCVRKMTIAVNQR